MVTHFYQAAWSPTRSFPLPGIHWGKEASVTQCKHTAAIVCPTLWCHSAFTSNTDSQWEDLEQRKPWSEVRSGLCHGLVTHTHTHANYTACKSTRQVQLRPTRACARCGAHPWTRSHKYTRTHTWGQCGAITPVLRDMVIICGVCIFRIRWLMPRRCECTKTIWVFSITTKEGFRICSPSC